MCFETKWGMGVQKEISIYKTKNKNETTIPAFSALEHIWTRLCLLVIHSHI